MSEGNISVQVFDKLQEYLNTLADQWVAEKDVISKKWISFNNLQLVKITNFLFNSLDGLIQFVEPLIPSGTDKKLAVLTAAGKLFDFISKEAFPLILTPFVPMIKKVIIDVLISNAIDFFVAKYNDGSWKTPSNTLTPNPPEGV